MNITRNISRLLKSLVFSSLLLFSCPCVKFSNTLEDPLDINVHDPIGAARYVIGSDMNTIINGSASMIGPWTGMSAAHVCHPEMDGSFVPGHWMFQAIDVFGNISLMMPVYIDIDHDICIWISSRPSSSWLAIAPSEVKLNEKIYAIAYPLGVYSPGVSLRFEGYYGGITESEENIYTMPATHGSSGGLIFNSKNEIVGIISKAIVGFESLTLGPQHLWIIQDIYGYNQQIADIIVIFEGKVYEYSIADMLVKPE